MSDLPFPIITIEGSPHSRGVQYGKQCQALISKTIAFYRKVFKYESNLDWNQSLQKSTEFIPYIQKYDFEIMEEIEGIAEGADCPLEEILAINVRSELLFLLTAQGKKSMKVSCTSLAATPEATSERETFLAQNWDWYVKTQNQCIILKIKQPGRPHILQLVEAGLIAKIGMNSAGIGMCTNAMVCNNWRVGVPFHVILRGILNAQSMSEAIGAVTKPDRASAGNFLIGHSDGEAINIEAGPDDLNIIYPERGVITHANHFQVPNSNIRDYIPSLWPDTIVRGHRAAKLLSADKNRINRRTIQNLLQDHFDNPFSICSHSCEKMPVEYTNQTNASIIINLSRQKFYVAKGPPCDHTYALIDKKDIF